jgi:hypothetical protein
MVTETTESEALNNGGRGGWGGATVASSKEASAGPEAPTQDHLNPTPATELNEAKLSSERAVSCPLQLLLHCPVL